MLKTREHRIKTEDGELYLKQWNTESEDHLAPIVMLHDSLGSVDLWRNFPEKIAEATQRKVIAYDRIGFGQSSEHSNQLQSDFISQEAHSGFKQVIKYLNVDKFIVLGHSVGGAMASYCAATYPKDCNALITIAAQSIVEEKTLAGIRQAKAEFAQVGQLDRLAKYHGSKAQWVLDAWTETWLDPAFKHWDNQDALINAQCPNLIIHGELDEYGSIHQAERYAELSVGHSTLKILPNLHHMPHKENEDQVVEMIQEFLMTIS